MNAVHDDRSPNLRKHALEYVSYGYPVFPVCSPLMGAHTHGPQACTSPGKRPLVSWEAYQRRCSTADEVRAWWGRWPMANIGMATGVVSGVVVLDCDSGEARKLALERGGLDKTPAVFTGKPGGIHYWLEHPLDEVRNFARRLPGLDFRGDGGYVLLPPSVHASGAKYTWAPATVGMRPSAVPDWLMELLRGQAAPDETREFRPGLDLDEILAGVGEGARNDTLFRYACKLRHDNVPLEHAELMLCLAARACRPSYDEGEAVEMVRRAYRTYEPAAGPTLVLDDGGWFSPAAEGVVAPSRAENEADEADEADDDHADATATPVRPASFLRPISELLAMPEEEPDWMVDQLFTVGSNGWVAAEPKVGKSWTVLELVYSLATGWPFLGRFAVKQPRRVIYIQEEDSLQRVLRRFKKLLKGDPSRVPPSDDYLRWSVREGFKLDRQDCLDQLCRELDMFPAEVVVLDVFNRLHGANENDQTEMTAILNGLLALNRKYGCAFIIVHHNKKPQAGFEARANQLIRGSGVLAGWSECSLYLRRSKDKDTIIVTPESKDAPELDDFTIVLRDQDNGGIVLEMGTVAPQDRSSKSDLAILEAIRSINASGMDATVQRIADKLGKERSGIQKRVRALVESADLEEDEVQMGRTYVKIYTVTTL